MSINDDRRPPHSNEAEQAILGACLIDNEAVDVALSMISSPKLFYSPKHVKIWDSIVANHEAKYPIDITTIGEDLDATGELQDAGGRSYLAELASGVATASNIAYYIKIVREKYMARELITQCSEVIGRAYRSSDPVDLANQAIVDIGEAISIPDYKDYCRLSEYFPEVITHIDDVVTKKVEPGILSGYSRLDNLTAGFQPGDFIVIGGRPSNGKTALMDCMAAAIASNGHSPLVFSAETSAPQYALRSLCREGSINSVNVRKGIMTDNDWLSLTDTASKMELWKYYIDPTRRIEINELLAKASKAHRERCAEIIFIDYLQLITSKRYQKEYDRLGYVSVALKDLAEHLGVTIIALAQLSREFEKRRSPKPRLSDLRGSGEIEQHADGVYFIHRPELYATEKEKNEGKYTGQAELIVAKQRNGPISVVPLYFNKSYTRFEEIQKEFGFNEETSEQPF